MPQQSGAAGIRAALGTVLSGINGLRVYDRWPNQVMEFPAAVIQRGRMEPEQNFGDGSLTRWEWTVMVCTSLVNGYDHALATLDPFIQTSSTGGIYQTIAQNRRLTDSVIYTFVQAIEEEEQFDLDGNISALGAVVELEIWTS